MQVDLFVPCFIDQLYPHTAFNVVKILRRAGCTVNYPENQTCCGQPAFNAGFTKEATEIATKFQQDFKSAQTIVCPGASCTGFVNNYIPTLIKSTTLKKAQEFSHILFHQLNYDASNAVFPHKVTYHDSCSGLRECGISKEPRSLLKQVSGLQLVELTDNTTCCGFGGTFAVKFTSISIAMAEQKLQHAMDTGAEYIISTDHSCLMQLQSVIDKMDLPIKTIHLADVLASGW